jgi:Putative lumazine-binding
MPMSNAVPPEDSERVAVMTVISTYFKGQATGDAKDFRSVFLPTAHIEGMLDGEFVSWTLDEFCGLYKGLPAPDEASRKRSVDSVDIVGSAAMAKATFRHGAVTFTDYFVLLKVDGV